MAVTPASLKTNNPEFADIPDAIVQAKIDASELQHNAEAWGDQLDTGIELYACHLLATSPHGGMARLISDDGHSIYQENWLRMSRGVGRAFRTLSGL
jgi:hypothetical protein